MLNVENLQIFSFLTVQLKELFSRKELVFFIYFFRLSLVVFLLILVLYFFEQTQTSFGDLDCIFKVTAVLCLNSGGSLKEYFSSLDKNRYM